MKNYVMIASVLVMGLLTAACVEAPDICDDWCAKQEECAANVDQMFSISRCQRECRDSKESHESVGCETKWVEMMECVIEVSCSDQDEKNDACGGEIESLNACIR